MTDVRSVLAQVKPRLAELVDELVAQGADRLSVVYVIEKEVAALRDKPVLETAKRAVEEPSNDWPAAG